MAADSRIPDVLALVLGAAQTQVMRVAAELGVADLLAAGPADVGTLAASTGSHEPALGRLMRALERFGLTEEVEPGTFALTDHGTLLRSDVPDSVRHYAMLMGGEGIGRTWPHLLHSVRTGESAFELVNGAPMYEYLRQHADEGVAMNQGMSELSVQEGSAIRAVYDFTPYRIIVDVGGGRGGLLASLLDAYPAARGVLLDLPHVAAEAETALAGYGDRCKVVGGDCLDAVPGGGDLYLMKRMLTDRTDETAVELFRNIREGIAPDGRLLVAEVDLDTDYGRALDMLVMVAFGGGLRSEGQLAELFERGGFAPTRSFDTASAVRLVEAKPV